MEEYEDLYNRFCLPGDLPETLPYRMIMRCFGLGVRAQAAHVLRELSVLADSVTDPEWRGLYYDLTSEA